MPADMLMDFSIWIAGMVFAGLLGGFVAGLLGVGGGIVIVPILYLVSGGMGCTTRSA